MTNKLYLMNKIKNGCINMGIGIDDIEEILVKTGRYPNRDEVSNDALRSLMKEKPELRKDIAVELYKNDDISLSKAAEISEMHVEDFKEILEREGVKIKLPEISSSELDEEVDWILDFF